MFFLHSFSKITIKSLLILTLFSNLNCNSKMPVSKSGVREAGICLSFDDASINNWYKYLNLLDSFGVKATFYISNFNKLTAGEKQKLHQIENRGHEIGYHTLNHYDMDKKEKSIGIKKLIETEIRQGMQVMKTANFYPKSFAFPYGRTNKQLNDSLLKYFKSLRCLNGSSDQNKSFVKSKGNSIMYAIGLDNSSGKSLETIKDLLQKASDNNNCIMLVAHNIEESGTNLQVPLIKLKAILQRANELNLKFYRTIDISR